MIFVPYFSGHRLHACSYGMDAPPQNANFQQRKSVLGFYTQQHICYSAYAIARPSIRLSITRVDQSKTVEVTTMHFSPYGSPIPLVFAG